MPERSLIRGAAGSIEIAADAPASPLAVAVIAHPHPLYGGTMDNKVVTTLERALRERGAATFRFNFRGIGASEGVHDEGRGETDDMVAVIEHAKRVAGDVPVWIAGFSFGGAVAVKASLRAPFARLVLVAPGFRRITAAGMGAPGGPARSAVRRFRRAHAREHVHRARRPGRDRAARRTRSPGPRRARCPSS